MPRPPASTAWRSTAPTATCSTSSCRTAPTTAPTLRRLAGKPRAPDAGSHRRRYRSGAPGRVGMHLAPRADAHDMGDANLAETFSYVARELGKRGIAFICAREKEGDDSLGPQLKEAFGGVYIANETFHQGQRQPRGWRAARRMPWRSACPSSPTPTCRHVWPRPMRR